MIDNKYFLKKLAVIALPIALQSLISSCLGLVDNLMVGSLGETELAAVGIATQLYMIHWMVMFGFSSGSSTFIAQFWGNKDLHSIRKTTGFAICVCFGVSILFFIAALFFPRQVMRIFTDIPEIVDMGKDYVRTCAIAFLTVGVTVPFTAALRTTQQTNLPLYISIFVFSTNTFLNYVFIFGNFGAPQMGIMGAALATSIARCMELLLVIIVVFVRKNIVSGGFREFFGWKKDFATIIFKNAIPTTVNEMMWSIGMAMYAAAYARVGITEYAAVQCSNVINNLFIMAAFSIGDATLILVGEKLGEGKVELAYELGKKFLKTGAFIGLFFGLLLVIFAKPLINFFELTPLGEKYAFYILVVNGAFMWLALFNGISVTGILRCGGDTRFAMISEIATVWIIGVPMAFISTMLLHLPIYIAVFLVKTEEIFKFFIMVKRFTSKKWAKNLTQHF